MNIYLPNLKSVLRWLDNSFVLQNTFLNFKQRQVERRQLLWKYIRILIRAGTRYSRTNSDKESGLEHCKWVYNEQMWANRTNKNCSRDIFQMSTTIKSVDWMNMEASLWTITLLKVFIGKLFLVSQASAREVSIRLWTNVRNILWYKRKMIFFFGYWCKDVFYLMRIFIRYEQNIELYNYI